MCSTWLDVHVRVSLSLPTFLFLLDIVKFGWADLSSFYGAAPFNVYCDPRFIPEFVSRMPTITTLAHLTPADLLRILTDVRGSLISQYTALFGYSGVEIKFTTPALKEICRKAAERGGGARGLRGIMVMASVKLWYLLTEISIGEFIA